MHIYGCTVRRDKNCILQVWFAGEKVGTATGKTRKEAQRQAAEESLLNLASKDHFVVFFRTRVGAYLILHTYQLVD